MISRQAFIASQVIDKFDLNREIAERKDLVEKVIDFYTAKVLNPGLFSKIQDSRRQSEFLRRSMPNLDICLRAGFLTGYDFHVFKDKLGLKNLNVSEVVVNSILAKMCKAGLLSEVNIPQEGNCATYQTNEYFVKFLGERSYIIDTILGFPSIVGKYSNSVLKITVQDEKGDFHIGTGFLVGSRHGERKIALLITNKHVAECENLEIISNESKSIKYNRVVFSKNKDLAAIVLDNPPTSPLFRLFEQANLLDEVVSIGYPNIATTTEAYQVAHKGEINSIIKDRYGDEFILFSAKTAPGNSGGPLINDIGFVVGIVSRDFFYSGALIEKGQLPYHAAIPSRDIQIFLNEAFPEGHISAM